MENGSKEVEIDWNGGKETVVLKRLDFVEKNNILDEVNESQVIGRETRMRFKAGKYRTILLLKSLKSAPFPLSIDGLKQLDPVMADKLYLEAEALQAPSEKKSSESEK